MADIRRASLVRLLRIRLRSDQLFQIVWRLWPPEQEFWEPSTAHRREHIALRGVFDR